MMAESARVRNEHFSISPATNTAHQHNTELSHYRFAGVGSPLLVTRLHCEGLALGAVLHLVIINHIVRHDQIG